VPGNPPGNVWNYFGPADYTNDRANSGYWGYTCAADNNYVDYLKGSTVYNLGLWFYPHERVKVDIININAQNQIGTVFVQSNAEGWTEFQLDTSNWPTSFHYHLILTGQSSGAQVCGHFDVIVIGEKEPELVPHTHENLDRIYRAAGVEVQ
jgi:hypothetical protein